MTIGTAIPVTEAPPYLYLREPAEIYRESFARIRGEVDFGALPDAMRAVAVRLVHAVADPGILSELAWSDEAASLARAALRAGAPILVDAEMVRHGLIASRFAEGNEIICTLNDPGVPARAAAAGITRSAAAVELWGQRIAGAVIAIGNAPTALFRLLEIVAETGIKPAAILGFPVGFVGAAESKAALIDNPFGLDFIALRGRRGGSALAAACVNALAGPEDEGLAP
jgi:precorrin-8X/cobalt-precorrin-8 methylmutase